MAKIVDIRTGAATPSTSEVEGTSSGGRDVINDLRAAISHDLRTPLNTIIGFADMMEREMLGPISNPRYREYVGVISKAGRGMLELVNGILDRKRFENIRGGEREYRHVIDLAPDLICICTNGLIDLMNPAGADMLGVWPAADLIGKPFTNFVQPDYQALFAGGMENLMNERLRVPMKLIRANNRELEVELAALAYSEDDGPEDRSHAETDENATVMLIARDMTERNRALQAITTREELLRKIMDTVTDGIITINEFGVIEMLNPAAETLFGYYTGELIGRNINELILDDSLFGKDGELKRYLETGVSRMMGRPLEVNGRRKDGSAIPVEVGVNEMRFSGRRLFIGAVRDITDRKETEERLRDLATRDPLTRLPNRNLFMERLERAIRKAGLSPDGGFAVLFADLDNFKTINDALGHVTGDRVIQLAGQRLSSCARLGDTVAHLSGDEFMIILEDVTDETAAAGIAQEMLDNLAKPFKVDGREVFTSGSIGVVMYPLNADSIVEIMRNVDTAVHFAKQQGRANYQFYNARLGEDVQRRLEMENGLRRAVDNGELELYFQAKVDLETRRVKGAEALIRWHHPTMGMVPPFEFITVAEKSGLIVPIGDWVLEEACRRARGWMDEGFEGMHVAVNLSAMQFLHGDLTNQVGRILEDTRLPASLLDLELTESMLVSNADETIRTLNSLKDQGVHVSMDDFGTGYSSLSYLTKFPLDSLKIDRAFVANLPDDPNAVAIARAIISMAQNLGLNIVAEGVETERQVSFLHALGCHVGQGYLFSKPIPDAEFIGLCRDTGGLFSRKGRAK